MTAPSSNFDVTVMLGALDPALSGRARRTRLGKPYLPGLAGFGVSDSSGTQARLYANRKYVGIDIEHLDRPDLAARQHRLAAWLARRDLVVVDFLAGWVAREACAKSVGLGLLHALPRLSITWARPLDQAGRKRSAWYLAAGDSSRGASGSAGCCYACVTGRSTASRASPCCGLESTGRSAAEPNKTAPNKNSALRRCLGLTPDFAGA
ncbi:4'-phosphopantetheinyl transferase superfamily protein [Achromobacter insuavis]